MRRDELSPGGWPRSCGQELDDPALQGHARVGQGRAGSGTARKGGSQPRVLSTCGHPRHGEVCHPCTRQLTGRWTAVLPPSGPRAATLLGGAGGGPRRPRAERQALAQVQLTPAQSGSGLGRGCAWFWVGPVWVEARRCHWGQGAEGLPPGAGEGARPVSQVLVTSLVLWYDVSCPPAAHV